MRIYYDGVKKRVFPFLVRPALIFVIENGRKSDFPPAKNPTTSSFDVLSHGDFGFI